MLLVMLLRAFYIGLGRLFNCAAGYVMITSELYATGMPLAHLLHAMIHRAFCLGTLGRNCYNERL
jgi:hypothetical protein